MTAVKAITEGEIPSTKAIHKVAIFEALAKTVFFKSMNKADSKSFKALVLSAFSAM